MSPPEALQTKSRIVIRAIVFINTVGGSCVKLATGSQADGLDEPIPTQQYCTKQGKEATSLTQEEYKDVVYAAVQHYCSYKPFSYVCGQAVPVHDRDPSHPKRSTLCLPTGVSIAALLQPPRSPDLMPLDYSVLGVVRSQPRPHRTITAVGTTWPKHSSTRCKRHR